MDARVSTAYRGLEGAIAVAQQHRHGAVVFVGDGQVELAVAGEVARHDRASGPPPTGIGSNGAEDGVTVEVSVNAPLPPLSRTWSEYVPGPM